MKILLGYIKLIFTLLLLCISPVIHAQLPVTKTISGDYTSITAAVADLNASGVGAGGVTFNVAAGYTETIAATISITATGTAANPIIFQKNGAGANHPNILCGIYINTATSANSTVTQSILSRQSCF